MQPVEKKTEKAAAETAVIISILRGTYRKEFDADEIIYSIHLYFVGATILPPFLPYIRNTATKKSRERILKKLKTVSDMYIESFRDLKLTPEDGKRIKNVVEEIGEDIAGYLSDFTQILQLIAKLNVKNIIIHTDDFDIPWTWAYYSLDIEQFQLEGHAKDFLCNRYPCGTLIVDSQEGSLKRLWKFLVDSNKSTDEELLNKFEVSLFQGSLPEAKIITTTRERGQYLKNLQEIFKKRFDKENIKLFTSDNWQSDSGNSDEFADRFLSGNIRNAKIIHYLGHVEDGALKFDVNTLTSPEDLKKSLYYLRQNPLVVLHGCSSGIIVDLCEKDTQLPTVFLEKGASGCVAALLPVSLPVCQEIESETLIDIFYRKVVVDMKPYGKALYEARRRFQQQEKTKHDPQWLFFQLYGDPRAMLITTSEKGHLRRLEYFWDILEKEDQKEALKKKKEPLEMKEVRIGLFYNDDFFDVDKLIEELKNDGYTDIKLEPVSITLSASPVGIIEMIGIACAFKILDIVVEKVASPVISDIVQKIKNKLKLKKKNLRAIKKPEKKQKITKNGKFLCIKDFSNTSSEAKYFEIVNDKISKDSHKNRLDMR